MSAEPTVVPETQALAPIVAEVVVPCDPARAFAHFTRDIARWWPLSSHSCGMDDAQQVAFEPRVGGRLVERTRSGTEHAWGEVGAWEPGVRIAFSWHPGRDAASATWVDVRFVADPGGTRVTLTHGGWERREAGARDNYVTGWRFVLGERFGGHCRQA